MNTTCRICNTEANENDAICSVCKYPLKGTKQEQASFGAKFIIQKGDIEDAIDRTKKSRIVLFILGGFYLIAPFTPLYNVLSNLVFYISLFLGVFFIGFGILSFKKPKISLLIPFATIVFYYLLLLLINPAYLWQGMVWKTIVIVILGYGYFSVRKADKIMKENKYIVDILEEEALEKSNE